MQMRREQIRPAVTHLRVPVSNNVLAGTALFAQTQCATAAGVKGPKNNTDPLAAGGASMRNHGTPRMSALWNRR